MGATRRGIEIPTIDVAMVAIKPYREDADMIILDTANKIGVQLATETTDKKTLIIKGRLISQKPQKTTVTGNTIVLTDNVFNFDVVKILQGGKIKTNEDGEIIGYTPPLSGSKDEGELFELMAYSAIYGANGVAEGYEKITYPNCQGVPIALTSEDDVFRVIEYTINSAPANGEPPYDMDIVPELPKPTVEGVVAYSYKSNAES